VNKLLDVVLAGPMIKKILHVRPTPCIRPSPPSRSARLPHTPTVEHPHSLEHSHTPTYVLALCCPHMAGKMREGERWRGNSLKQGICNITNHHMNTSREKCCNMTGSLKQTKSLGTTSKNMLLQHRKTHLDLQTN
jgi:hypothetical protein